MKLFKKNLKSLYFLLPNPVKKNIRGIFKQLKNFKILSNDYGQFFSLKNWECIDRSGQFIPWYTYPTIEYLKHLDLSKFNVFEFGSGYSTLFWSQVASSVFAVEDNSLWFDRIKQKSKSHEIKFGYIYAPDHESYIQAFRDYKQVPHIVIIDGKWRNLCAKDVCERMHQGDELIMIIFDNSDWYPNTIEKIRSDLNWIEVDFHGFGPINNYTWTTTIFLNPRANPIPYLKPLMSVSGLQHNAEDTSSS